MNLFDYMYCRLYWWNTKMLKEKETPSVDACGIFVWGSTYVNAILSVSHLYLILGLIILVVDSIYYDKERRKRLYLKFINLIVDKKKKLDVFCFLYIIIIVVLNVLLSNYMRLKYV